MSNAFEQYEANAERLDHAAVLIGGAVVPQVVKPDQIPRGLSLVREELPTGETLEDIWGKQLKASTINRPSDQQTIGR